MVEILNKVKLLLGNPIDEDELLTYLLDVAKTTICDIRNTDEVETKYVDIQVKMAVEMYNKRGAEGQLGHDENGISRSYSSADISHELLSQVTPFARTPFSKTR